MDLIMSAWWFPIAVTMLIVVIVAWLWATSFERQIERDRHAIQRAQRNRRLVVAMREIVERERARRGLR